MKQKQPKRRQKLSAAERNKRISIGLKLVWQFRKQRGMKWKKVP